MVDRVSVHSTTFTSEPAILQLLVTTTVVVIPPVHCGSHLDYSEWVPVHHLGSGRRRDVGVRVGILQRLRNSRVRKDLLAAMPPPEPATEAVSPATVFHATLVASVLTHQRRRDRSTVALEPPVTVQVRHVVLVMSVMVSAVFEFPDLLSSEVCGVSIVVDYDDFIFDREAEREPVAVVISPAKLRTSGPAAHPAASCVSEEDSRVCEPLVHLPVDARARQHAVLRTPVVVVTPWRAWMHDLPSLP
jgi:hypothetical protein